MEIGCPGCGRRYKVADEKLPASDAAVFMCPNCHERICVEVPKRPEDTQTREDIPSNIGLEYFSPDTKTALIYCPETAALAELEQKVRGLGYEVRQIEGRLDLHARLRYHVYDLVLLYQRGADPEAPLKEILDYIHTIPIQIRRKILVLYVQVAGNRRDNFLAFSMSVDLTITPLDCGQLETILPRGLEEKQTRYKTFIECLTHFEGALA